MPRSTRTRLRPANLFCRSREDPNDTLEIGKTYWYDDGSGYCVHADVYPRFMRHDIRAWGIRAPLAAFCDEHGIRFLFFWDKKQSRTYSITLDEIRLHARLGETDRYGGTINVPAAHWQTIHGKLPGVPWITGRSRIELPYCVTPWEMPVWPTLTTASPSLARPAAAKPTPAPRAPRPEQLALDF